MTDAVVSERRSISKDINRMYRLYVGCLRSIGKERYQEGYVLL